MASSNEGTSPLLGVPGTEDSLDASLLVPASGVAGFLAGADFAPPAFAAGLGFAEANEASSSLYVVEWRYTHSIIRCWHRRK